MSNEPQLEKRAEAPYVAIPITATLPEWDQVNALVADVFGWLSQHGTAPAGPPFYRYRRIGGMDEKFELEVGVPVAEPVSGDCRVVAGSKPAGTYLVRVHHGHPDELFEVHRAVLDWAAREGVVFAKDGAEWRGMIESFLTDPAVEPDLAKWDTELAYLVSSTGTAS